MSLREALLRVWEQIMVAEADNVELDGKSFPVALTSRNRLRTVEFSHGRLRIAGIEQNPQTASHWAKLARQGKRIVQFRCAGRYIGNVTEGKLTRYPAWHSLHLPE